MALSLTNYHPFQGTVTTPTTLTFPWKAREITIINDSDFSDLEFKFNLGETYGILGGGETVTIRLGSKTVLLNGSSVPYRVWGIG